MVGASSHARYVSCILYMFGFDDKPGISKTAIIVLRVMEKTMSILSFLAAWKFTSWKPRNKSMHQELEVVQPCVFPPWLSHPSCTVVKSHVLPNQKLTVNGAKWQYVIPGSTRRKSISNGSIITTRVISAKGRFRSPNHKQQPTTNEPPPNWTIWC